MLSCTANADDISTSLAKTVPSVYDSQQEEMSSMEVFLLLHHHISCWKVQTAADATVKSYYILHNHHTPTSEQTYGSTLWLVDTTD